MTDYKKTILELFKQKSFPNYSENSVHNLLDNKKILLVGGGELGVSFLFRIVRRYGFNVYAVLDRKFKSGNSFYGIPAFSPFEYQPTSEEREGAIVVIAILKPEYFKEIYNHLRNLGFKNIISALDIYEIQLCQIPPELEQKGFNYYLDNKEKILKCFEIFGDELSREIFTIFISIHMQRKPNHIPNNSLEEQYFPKDVKLNKGYSRFINCGAYNGDTIKRLNSLVGKIETLVCFEPNRKNFESLSRYLCAEYNKIATEIIALPLGVFNDETQTHFFEAEASSAISDRGDSFIQCVALDHIIPNFQPTFINMDIEGAELKALMGAQKIIKENKPDLAISVYHSPNHIWNIPLYLEELKLGYKFYLRNYTSFTNETILYATA